MGQKVILTGLILASHPYDDFDRRLVILTKERGKITAFSKGARRPNSQLLACSRQFAFGEFELFEGRSSFNLMNAHISRFFEKIPEDLELTCYGCYFCEMAEYYTRESNDEIQMLKLLYASLSALEKNVIPNILVRYIYELKTMVINGDCPVDFDNMDLSESAAYALKFIAFQPIEKLYTFTVTEEVLKEIGYVMNKYRQLYCEGHFKSLGILDSLII